MKLTTKLLGLLNKVFDVDPARFLALRIAYNGTSLKWTVLNGYMTTTVTGGTGANLVIDLSQYTLSTLVNYITTQPGYSVPTLSIVNGKLSALVLLDGSGDVASSNGDHLYGYTNLIWAYMEAMASELTTLRNQIPNAIAQMTLKTAQDVWIDEIGGYYGIRRNGTETDSDYSTRIIAEVVRPKTNNVAMEAAISYYTGQSTKVTDVVVYGNPFPRYDGTIRHDSLYKYQPLTSPQYGLFDVEYGYDLLSGSDPTSFAQTIRGIIERIRAAGTHLRSLLLRTGSISDEFIPPTDGALSFVVSPALTDSFTAPTEPATVTTVAMAPLSDTADAASDSASLTIAYNYQYNSVRRYNGTIFRMGNSTVVESI